MSNTKQANDQSRFNPKPPLTILLQCPGCKRHVHTPRTQEDPPEATAMSMYCEECDHTGFELVNYYNRDGEWVGGSDE